MPVNQTPIIEASSPVERANMPIHQSIRNNAAPMMSNVRERQPIIFFIEGF
jgi:hypothetical protein